MDAGAPPISPDSLLERAPDLRMHLRPNGTVEFPDAGPGARGGSRTLAILDLFTRPHSLREALGALAQRSSGALDWADAAETIRQLCRAGVLRPPGAPVQPGRPTGFDSPLAQGRMLDDRVRTQSYLAAIREVVRPDDVVVDIGTGTGVLAIAAARAGARHVYAVEAGSILEVAREIARANGVEERITFVRGWSTQIELPEPADVVVSEILGNDPFGEGVVDTIRDALRRLARPGARLIPNRLRLLALPLEIPSDGLEALMVNQESVARWREWYGLDFQPLVTLAAADGSPRYLDPGRARNWTSPGDPALLVDVHLGGIDVDPWRAESRLSIRRGGTLSGLLLYFEAVLSPGVTLSMHPERCGETHWRCPLWPLAEPLPVRAGETLRLDYRYGRGGSRLEVRRESAA